MPPTPPVKRHPYDQWAPDARALDLVGDKWTLLIVRDLIPGPRRFVELQRVLPGISTEQLRSRLNRMVADGLLTRQRYREVPPRVDYELTDRSRALLPVLGALARWGYDWSWSDPREGEALDIGAILRVAPGHIALAGKTLDNGDDVEVVVDLIVDNDEGTTQHYAVHATGGEVRIEEAAAKGAQAQVRGDQSAWIRALSPVGDRAGLRFYGDRRLADTVLDAVAPAGAVPDSAVA